QLENRSLGCQAEPPRSGPPGAFSPVSPVDTSRLLTGGSGVVPKNSHFQLFAGIIQSPTSRAPPRFLLTRARKIKACRINAGPSEAGLLRHPSGFRIPVAFCRVRPSS